MKLRELPPKILLMLSLTVSASASEVDLTALTKLTKGDRAPFSGHLIDEDSLREIDFSMTDLKICEYSLSADNSRCSSESSGLFPFLIGMAVGALAYSELAK